MAEVFLAETEAPGFPARLVVKRVHPGLADDPDVQRMFLDEARVCAHLQDPRFVRIYEVGNVDGALFMATEFIDGVTIDQLSQESRRRGKPVPWEIAAHVALSFCDALEALHGAKSLKGEPLHLLHRDLKPANVMVSRAGELKVIDFGIARSVLVQLHRTRPGVAKLSVAYAAPEQLRGEALDERTDLYGAALVVHELLAGRRAYSGEPTTMWRAILQGDAPSLRAARPDAPMALCDAVHAAMAVAREERPPSASALKATIRAAVPQLTETSSPALAAWVGELFPQVAPAEVGAQHTVNLAAQPGRPVEGAPPSVDALSLGDTIGRYELKSRLGSGGMAEVWLAKQRGQGGFEKTVALKTISAQWSDDEAFVAMFLEEAKLAALLNHPNVVQTFDFGADRGHYYIAMEYLDGRTLRQVLTALARQNRTLPAEVAARIVSECAAGLHAAHELKDDEGRGLGLIHRDVSPENIVITYSGQVKVIDFGIAAAMAQRQGGGTEANQLKGKFAYLSPEQVEGRSLDRRIDVWALGVVLYEALTHRRPFQARGQKDAADWMHAVLHAEREPLPATVRPELQAVAAQALERNRAARWPSAKAMRDELEAYLQGQPAVSSWQLASLMSSLFPSGTPATSVDGADGTHAASGPAMEAPSTGAASPSADALLARQEEPPDENRRPPAARFWVGGGLAAGLALAVWVGARVSPTRDGPSTLDAGSAVSGVAAAGGVSPRADDGPRPEVDAGATAGGASLELSCNLGCSLFVDDQPVGVRRATVRNLAGGSHRVRAVAARSEGGAVKTRDVTLGETGSEALVFSFDTGFLAVRAKPWADVFVNGRKLGQTPLPPIRLYEGTWTLELVNDDLVAKKRREVTIQADRTTRVDETLKRR